MIQVALLEDVSGILQYPFGNLTNCIVFVIPWDLVNYSISINMLISDHISSNREPSPEGFESFNFESEITIKWLHSTRAHQQPLTCLVVEAGIIVTGSQVHF